MERLKSIDQHEKKILNSKKSGQLEVPANCNIQVDRNPSKKNN